jgi:hypothetical protein
MILYGGSYSQAGQESFVINALKEKRNGFYVEIGAYDSKIMSNTYLLETEYGWSGMALEIDPARSNEYNSNRSNKCVTADATTFNYLDYFIENNVPERVDYLQVDIEPAPQSLQALKALPLDRYRFSIVTFEHDLYVDPSNSLVKQEAIEILTKYNYKLVKENVMHEGNIFEDWWIDREILEEVGVIC